MINDDQQWPMMLDDHGWWSIMMNMIFEKGRNSLMIYEWYQILLMNCAHHLTFYIILWFLWFDLMISDVSNAEGRSMAKPASESWTKDTMSEATLKNSTAEATWKPPEIKIRKIRKDKWKVRWCKMPLKENEKQMRSVRMLLNAESSSGIKSQCWKSDSA